ncbi:hypothetical protein B9Z55_010254 [Caenorhabditis nigoni]|uniref:Uncharacterized protein n=1 Tax=Caenorhabditis nigoni TaxID=1611254 RepID=A0A2G5UF17_9PELO|nr:hypothetical protein B9Z55_010254 [Caenorhabditis nigoni]
MQGGEKTKYNMLDITVVVVKAVRNAAAAGRGRGRGYFAVDQSGRSFENKLSYPGTTRAARPPYAIYLRSILF